MAVWGYSLSTLSVALYVLLGSVCFAAATWMGGIPQTMDFNMKMEFWMIWGYHHFLLAEESNR